MSDLVNDSINDRIAFVVEQSGCTKTEFAKKMMVTQQYISKLCKCGVPSDRTVAQICEKFNVNKSWLLFGVGSPFVSMTRDEEIYKILSDAIGQSSPEKRRLIMAIARLPDEAFPLIEQLVLAVAKSVEKEKKSGE